MGWKNLTIGKKIASGFGLIIILLIAIGALSFFGVGGIVDNAEEVINGNKLEGNLTQKEVDHLNWANQVNALLTDEKITDLKVQTDHRKCGFGEWLYGEKRKNAEALIPSLTPLLKEIEPPHQRLHQSAIEIANVFKQPHTGLALTLSDRLTDHVNWVGQLGKSLAFEAGGLYSYQIQLKNAVDQSVSAIKASDQENKLVGRDVEFVQDEAYEDLYGLRYGPEEKDYFFIIDVNTKMVMHPFKPILEGRDLSKIKDPAGKLLFAEMVKICKEKGEGFVTYQWPLPGTDQLAPKITFVKLYKPWGWIVGTGVYLDKNNPSLLKRADDFATGKPFSSGIQLDPTKCAFGRFLANPKTKTITDSFPELKTSLEAVVAPHNKLHKSAVSIEAEVTQLKMPEAIEIFKEVSQSALKEIKTHFQQAINAETALQNGLAEGNRIYTEKSIPNLILVQDLLGKIRKEAKANIMTDQAMVTAANATKRNVTLTSAMAIALGLFLAFIISKGIINALTKITNGLGEGADQVASSASQVSSSSQSMADGASQQAASIEETSSSMEEMSAMTKKNAENADNADDLMKETNQVVKHANDSMDQLTLSMEEISKASEETSKIIKTIDEIAFQTNLLALNAAVEAARAGEAGAGFAVVADEVRNLAMRAADAAKSTSELIEGTVQKVNDGSKLLSTTNEAFDRVAETTLHVGELVSEISEASKEQSSGIDQVNNAITQMDKVVQQNAASAEESASASEEMNAQAEQLRNYVEDLIMLIKGKKENKGAFVKEQTSILRQEHDPTPKKRLAERRSKEIGPDQEIPLEDDEFNDF